MIRRLAALVAGILLMVGGAALAQYAGANYFEAGTQRLVIGGTASVASGGTLNVESGGALKIAGTDKTTAISAAVTAPVAGVAAGYKVARGETALDGSNPTAAATGLTTIVACTAAIKTATAPGVGTSAVTYDTSGATLNLYGWKVTSAIDATLIASTGTETVGWICVGT